MRKLIAITVALGFLASTSLPTFAATAAYGVVKSDDLSAKKKKKMDKKDEMKKTELSTDLFSAASHEKPKAKKTKKKKMKKDEMKKTELSTDLFSAASHEKPKAKKTKKKKMKKMKKEEMKK